MSGGKPPVSTHSTQPTSQPHSPPGRTLGDRHAGLWCRRPVPPPRARPRGHEITRACPPGTDRFHGAPRPPGLPVLSYRAGWPPFSLLKTESIPFRVSTHTCLSSSVCEHCRRSHRLSRVLGAMNEARVPWERSPSWDSDTFPPDVRPAGQVLGHTAVLALAFGGPTAPLSVAATPSPPPPGTSQLTLWCQPS